MSSRPLVALILGAGPRVGASVARKFAQMGYCVAVASRTGTLANEDTIDILHLKVDLANLDAIPGLFQAVRDAYGAFPAVVVYNTGAVTIPPNGDIFDVEPSKIAYDLGLNTISPYVAAREALKGWKSLSLNVKKTFIYTGNNANISITPMPMMLNVGMGKAASASWIGLADAMLGVDNKRFFYAAERNVEGGNKGAGLDGDAHGEFYAELALHPQIPWHATFVKGRSYVNFQS